MPRDKTCSYYQSDKSVCLRPVVVGETYCEMHRSRIADTYELYYVRHEVAGQVGARPTFDAAMRLLDRHLEAENDPNPHAHRIDGPGV